MWVWVWVWVQVWCGMAWAREEVHAQGAPASQAHRPWFQPTRATRPCTHSPHLHERCRPQASSSWVRPGWTLQGTSNRSTCRARGGPPGGGGRVLGF